MAYKEAPALDSRFLIKIAKNQFDYGWTSSLGSSLSLASRLVAWDPYMLDFLLRLHNKYTSYLLLDNSLTKGKFL